MNVLSERQRERITSFVNPEQLLNNTKRREDYEILPIRNGMYVELRVEMSILSVVFVERGSVENPDAEEFPELGEFHRAVYTDVMGVLDEISRDDVSIDDYPSLLIGNDVYKAHIPLSLNEEVFPVETEEVEITIGCETTTIDVPKERVDNGVESVKEYVEDVWWTDIGNNTALRVAGLQYMDSDSYELGAPFGDGNSSE